MKPGPPRRFTRQPVILRVPAEMLVALDRYARQHHSGNRSDAARELLDRGLSPPLDDESNNTDSSPR